MPATNVFDRLEDAQFDAHEFAERRFEPAAMRSRRRERGVCEWSEGECVCSSICSSGQLLPSRAVPPLCPALWLCLVRASGRRPLRSSSSIARLGALPRERRVPKGVGECRRRCTVSARGAGWSALHWQALFAPALRSRFVAIRRSIRLCDRVVSQIGASQRSAAQCSAGPTAHSTSVPTRSQLWPAASVCVRIALRRLPALPLPLSGLQAYDFASLGGLHCSSRASLGCAPLLCLLR